jgi:hypothetical protein
MGIANALNIPIGKAKYNGYSCFKDLGFKPFGGAFHCKETLSADGMTLYKSQLKFCSTNKKNTLKRFVKRSPLVRSDQLVCPIAVPTG